MTNPQNSTHPAPHNQQGSRWLALAALIVIVVLGAVFVVANNVSDTNDPLVSDAELVNDVPTITVTDQGFEPEEMLVLPNARVRFVNNTDEPRLIASGPFPENDAYPQLNASEPIGPGESFETSIGDSGTYTYVDNYDPLLSGIITVFDDPEQ